MTAPVAIQKDSLFNLTSRVKLRVAGADRLRFLNGQITNDIRQATSSGAIEACILSAKGKMNAHVFISSGPDCFFLDADPELRDVLRLRLDRYVIADDVQIEEVTQAFSLFHVLTRASPQVGGKIRTISALRFVETGWDLWTESALGDSLLQQLSLQYGLSDVAAAEVFRIEQGIPSWGRELSEEIIPIEANLEARTVDYGKGCYIGQEVISRIKMSGQTNKRLCGLVSAGRPLSAGMTLVAPAEKEKKIGWITSAVRSDRLGEEIALGYIKRGFNDLGTKLEACATGEDAPWVPVEVVPLPFA